ncbi:MAG TPA: hypothetical protein VLE91_04610 [Candidatus Saccharimonadales bacterium]|nr:hypothetical protein [Candidatus Saccharimonadales bacterium]
MTIESESKPKRKGPRATPEGYMAITAVSELFKTSPMTLSRVAAWVETDSSRPIKTDGQFIDISELGRLSNGMEAYPARIVKKAPKFC